MILRVFYILLLLQVSAVCFSQEKFKEKSGKVSLITSHNVYVKFDNTDGITIGDTLKISAANALNPCMVVQYKSSTSCVCVLIKGCEVKKGDMITSSQKINTDDKGLNGTPNLNSNSISKDSGQSKKNRSKKKERIVGSVSASSNSNLSTIKVGRHRTTYGFSLDADHINESKFSFETDMSYSQNFIPIEGYPRQKTFLRVHNLSCKYDVDSTMSVVAGRQINRKTSSLGAFDGLQGEKHFGNFYVGLLGGFRPDIFNYNFNSNMLQYGAYVGIKSDNKSGHILSTLGLLEQKNGAEVDRRYAYFQHSSTINRNINIFSSGQLDLYSKVNGIAGDQIRLTNLYISTQYKIIKWMDIFLSYDSRKQILYYETFKSSIETFLNADDARQVARIRLNFKPIKKVSIGIGYSKRFQSSGQNKSDDYDGYITYSKLPFIGGALSFNYNANASNYLQSRSLSLRHSRSMIKDKLSADVYIRMVNYVYSLNEMEFEQKYFGCGFSYSGKRRILFGISGEMAIAESETNYRINARIIKRFQNK